MKKVYNFNINTNQFAHPIQRMMLIAFVLLMGFSLKSNAQVPSPPTFINCTAVSSTQVNVDWEACTGAFDYYVQIDNSNPYSVWGIGSGINHVYAPTISKTFTGLTPGTTYYVHVAAVNSTWEYTGVTTSAGCATLMGVDETENTLSLKVYPNPTINELTIEIKGNSQNTRLEIYNSIGELLYNRMMTEKISIPTTNLPAGVYLIKLDDGKSISFKKFVKE